MLPKGNVDFTENPQYRCLRGTLGRWSSAKHHAAPGTPKNLGCSHSPGSGRGCSLGLPRVSPGWQPRSQAVLKNPFSHHGKHAPDRDPMDVWEKQKMQIEVGLLDYGQPHANRAILIWSANTWLGIRAAPEYTEAAGDY